MKGASKTSEKIFSKKSDRVVYSPSSPARKFIQEQLGLYLYPEKEKRASVLEVKKSQKPKVSKFNDIDLNKWKE